MAMILRHGMLAIFEKKKSTGTKKRIYQDQGVLIFQI